MKLALLDGSFQYPTISGANQISMNMYPIDLAIPALPSGNFSNIPPAGRENWGLRRTPGLLSTGITSSTPILTYAGIRGLMATDQYLYAVSSNQLYRGTYTASTQTTSWAAIATVDLAPTLNPSANAASIVRWGRNTAGQIFFTDSINNYIWSEQSNTLTVINGSTSGFDGAGDIAYLDGYFVVFAPGTAQMQTSSLNDGTTWNGLNIANTAGNPNHITGLLTINRQLWVICSNSVEVWYDAGNSPGFPLSPIPGLQFQQIGCVTRNTIAQTDNYGFFLDPRGFIYQIYQNGITKISTVPLDATLASFPILTDCYAYVHAAAGGIFYVLNSPSQNMTFCYDITTQRWHNRSTLNSSGLELQHRAINSVEFNGLYFVGDSLSNTVGLYSPSIYADFGSTLKVYRKTQFPTTEMEQLGISTFKLQVERGVGTGSGQGQDPKMWLRYSNTGGHTWSSELYRSLGAPGDYSPWIFWNRLGTGRDWQFEFGMTDPIQFALYNASIIKNGVPDQ